MVLQTDLVLDASPYFEGTGGTHGVDVAVGGRGLKSLCQFHPLRTVTARRGPCPRRAACGAGNAGSDFGEGLLRGTECPAFTDLIYERDELGIEVIKSVLEGFAIS